MFVIWGMSAIADVDRPRIQCVRHGTGKFSILNDSLEVQAISFIVGGTIFGALLRNLNHAKKATLPKY